VGGGAGEAAGWELVGVADVLPAGLLLADEFGDGGIDDADIGQQRILGDVTHLKGVIAGEKGDAGFGEAFPFGGEGGFVAGEGEDGGAVEDDFDVDLIGAEGDAEVVDVADDAFEAGLFAGGHLEDDVVLFTVLGEGILSGGQESREQQKTKKGHGLIL